MSIGRLFLNSAYFSYAPAHYSPTLTQISPLPAFIIHSALYLIYTVSSSSGRDLVFSYVHNIKYMPVKLFKL